MAETFDLEMPDHTLSKTTDAETADYIARQIPAFGPERRILFDELLQTVLKRAVAACRAAQDALAELADAETKFTAAQASGGYWLDEMRARIDGQARQMARLSVVAYTKAEEARGISRAVRLARSGETWAPRHLDAEFEALLPRRGTGS